jgi:hypothetical protein
LTKRGWATFWAIFSPAHPVTLLDSNVHGSKNGRTKSLEAYFLIWKIMELLTMRGSEKMFEKVKYIIELKKEKKCSNKVEYPTEC